MESIHRSYFLFRCEARWLDSSSTTCKYLVYMLSSSSSLSSSDQHSTLLSDKDEERESDSERSEEESCSESRIAIAGVERGMEEDGMTAAKADIVELTSMAVGTFCCAREGGSGRSRLRPLPAVLHADIEINASRA